MPIGRLLLVVCVLLWGSPVIADDGPLQVKNRFPLHLLFLTPRPTSPELPAAGEWQAAAAIDYSAIHFHQDNRDWDFLVDLEMTTFNLALTCAVSPGVALSFDLAAVNMGGGFLDGFLENYHDALGVSNYGREERPKNEFAYQVRRQGELWLRGESSEWQMADSVVSALIRLPAPDSVRNLQHALITSLKLPLGDAEAGTGSGAWDFGLYWTAAYHPGSWSFYLMPGVALISDPRNNGPEVTARNSYSLVAGAAYHYSDRWRWLVQMNGFSSPIQRTGIGELDNGAVELAFGFHYRLNPRWRIEFAFSEDLTRAAPDFTVHWGFLWGHDWGAGNSANGNET
jgi:hypothetical protein